MHESSWSRPSRTRWTEDDGEQLAHAVTASGLSCRAFALRNGLQYQRVRYWIARSRDRQRQSMRPSFASVKLTERRSTSGAGVEVLVGEHRVRLNSGFCTETLRQVLAVLGEHGC